MSEVGIFLLILLVIIYLTRRPSPRYRVGYVRLHKITDSPPPVTPQPGINPTCPNCDTWLRDLGDVFGCLNCGFKTKDIRKSKDIPSSPWKVKENEF